MEVSWNGYPKSPISLGFPIINHHFWDSPHLWKPPNGCFITCYHPGHHHHGPCKAIQGAMKGGLATDVAGTGPCCWRKGDAFQDTNKMIMYCISCISLYKYICMYVCMYVRMYVCMHACMYVCLNMFIQLCKACSPKMGGWQEQGPLVWMGKEHPCQWYLIIEIVEWC